MPYTPWVTERTNLITQPVPLNGNNAPASGFLGSRWFGASPAGGTYTTVADPTAPENAGAFRRKTWTTAPAGMGSTGDTGYNILTGSRIAVNPGDRIHVRGWLRSSVQRAAYVRGTWYNASSGGTAVAATSGPLVSLVPGEWVLIEHYFTVPAGQTHFGSLIFDSGANTNFGSQPWVVGSTLDGTAALLEFNTDGPFFAGSTPSSGSLERRIWSGVANASPSFYQTRVLEFPPAVVPTPVLSVEDFLYSDRNTSYRWEVLEHVNGVDVLVGTLDGVSDGSLTWTQNAAVKGAGNVRVIDLDQATPGMMEISELTLESVRLRPVISIEGLPESPLGVYLVSSAGETWERTGRVWSLELLDKTTVASQDAFDQSYAVAAGTLILREVRKILGTCNEFINIDLSNLIATSGNMVWEAGTSKLTIINDLLDVAGYNSLWIDGEGTYQTTPRVLPANRSLTYELLGVPRELRDGERAIYEPDWTRDRDSFEVPNKVIAIQAAGGEDEAAIIGVWTNEDPSSPYSYQARGRWVPHVLDSVDTPDGTPAEILKFLQNRAQTTLVQMSSVQAEVKLSHLPIPIRVGEVLQFANSTADVDARHVITRVQLDTHPLGLMKTTLQEVISL